MAEDADVQELIDRQRIWECLLRYTRGMDRLDRDQLMSAYHADAMEDHGAVIAPAAIFADQVLGFHRERELATLHIMTNHWCEIDGAVAHAETYVSCYSVSPEGKDTHSFGRFVDRLEKRDGRWGIVNRVSVREGSANLSRNEMPAGMTSRPGSLAHTRRDSADASYMRPLAIVRGPQA